MVQSYAAGTKFVVQVKYTWNGNPNPDFTLKVYSKFAGVDILDSSNKPSKINYDGKSPSGFKNSNYTGMTTDCNFLNITQIKNAP